MSSASGKDPVRSVVRALRLLKVLGSDRSGASLSEFAREGGLPPSTTLRLLQTLESEGFLSRLEDGTYTFGATILHLGLAAKESIQLVDVAHEHLDRITQSTGETTNLGIRASATGVLYVDQRLSQHSLRSHSWLGRIVPIDGTSIGAALEGRVNAEGWTATAKTIEVGITAIASPIYDHSGEIVAAINITGPTSRLVDRVEKCGRLLAQETAAATSRIGGTWPHHPAEAVGTNSRAGAASPGIRGTAEEAARTNENESDGRESDLVAAPGREE